MVYSSEISSLLLYSKRIGDFSVLTLNFIVSSNCSMLKYIYNHFICNHLGPSLNFINLWNTRDINTGKALCTP